MFRDKTPVCDLCDNPIAVRNAVKRAGRFKGNKFDVCMTCWDCEGFDGSTKAELEEIEKDHQQHLKRMLRLTLQQALDVHECYPEFSKAKVSEVYLDGSLTTEQKHNKIQTLMRLFEPNTQYA